MNIRSNIRSKFNHMLIPGHTYQVTVAVHKRNQLSWKISEMIDGMISK